MNRISLNAKLWAALLAMWLALLALGTWSAIHTRANMMDERRQSLQSLVATAEGIVKLYVDRAAKGAMSTEDAQTAAKDALREMRFGDKGYLFLLKPQPVFKARVNMSSISYPFQRLTYDTVTLGAYTDIEPGMTVLVITTTWKSVLRRSARPTDSHAGSAERSENPPSGSLGVGTIRNVTSDQSTASAVSRVAVILPRERSR